MASRWVRLDSMRPSWGTEPGTIWETGSRTSIRRRTIKARSRTALPSGSSTTMLQASGTIAPTPSLGRRWEPVDLMRASWGTAIGATLETGLRTSIRQGTTRARSRTDLAQRFLYKYASGQWYHSGDTLSWQVLGAGWTQCGFRGGPTLARSG